MCVQAIKRVEDGSFLDETLDRSFSRYKLTEAQKGLIYEIVSGVVRWKGYLDWILSQYARKTVKNELKHLLRVSLYQISFMKKGAYHIVNESVEYAKNEHGPFVANFVNAVLRNFIRETDVVHHRPVPAGIHTIENLQDSIPLEAGRSQISNLSIIYSFPEWLIGRWLKRFGYDETIKLLTNLNKPPEFSIRVNLNKISRDEVMHRLEDKGIGTKKGRFLESALYVERIGPVLKDELFKKGLIHVQDEASQLAGLSIRSEKGGLILDACAGQGTKTEQMKEQFDVQTIIAMDSEIKRLKFIAPTIMRVIGDAACSPFKDGAFDAILLDAPCSSFGIIRKHPEIKWRRAGKDIAAFGDYQFNLLKSLWTKLKPGGHLVYSVCSFEPEETVFVVDRFKKEEMFILENPLPLLFNKNMEYYLSLPHETAMDGFFIARLRKI
ncbi:MAG: 16S rRNA (cytosine(967)-C(5))-methyltransferase RsmB [Proteobacteria bacterium]|nr:16S rRNA (cytosine(967)-C(5))-methyltransferase RsmB [Pseudomonadota bacterium]